LARNGKVDPEKFKELYFAEKTSRELKDYFGIGNSTIFYWRKKLLLPKRHLNHYLWDWKYKGKKYYQLRQEGMSDKEIAEKHYVSKFKVGACIGRFLMSKCRVNPTCPFKALLPEYEGSI